MNIILFAAKELKKNQLNLDDCRARHIHKILKSRPGDILKVGVLNGPRGSGMVRSISPSQVTLDIKLDNKPVSRPMTDLILALPRPIMLKRILAQSACLGVDNIYLINSRRVEKSFFNASLLKDEIMTDYLCHGLEQAGTTMLPRVAIHPRFRPFVEDMIPRISLSCPVRLMAHPLTSALLPQVIPVPLREKVLLAVGPEGGWLDYEIEKFREQEFKLFSMGPRILKVETAVTALLAQLELLRHFQPAGG